MKKQSVLLLTGVCLVMGVVLPGVAADEPKQSGETKVVPPQSGPEAKLYKKLKAIRIPEVDFRQANLDDVLKFLGDASKEFDTATPKAGVRFVFVSKGKGKDGVGVDQGTPLITFNAQQVALYDALKIICDIGNLTFKLSGGDMVIVSPKGK